MHHFLITHHLVHHLGTLVILNFTRVKIKYTLVNQILIHTQLAINILSTEICMVILNHNLHTQQQKTKVKHLK